MARSLSHLKFVPFRSWPNADHDQYKPNEHVIWSPVVSTRFDICENMIIKISDKFKNLSGVFVLFASLLHLLAWMGPFDDPGGEFRSVAAWLSGLGEGGHCRKSRLKLWWGGPLLAASSRLQTETVKTCFVEGLKILVYSYCTFMFQTLSKIHSVWGFQEVASLDSWKKLFIGVLPNTYEEDVHVSRSQRTSFRFLGWTIWPLEGQ